jgi:hypothetical protein
VVIERHILLDESAYVVPLLEVAMRATGNVLDDAPPLSWGILDLAMLTPDANNEHLGVILKTYHRQRTALAYLISRHTHIRALRSLGRQDFPGGARNKQDFLGHNSLKLFYQIALTFPSHRRHQTLTKSGSEDGVYSASIF